jgi:hypothetical protein
MRAEEKHKPENFDSKAHCRIRCSVLRVRRRCDRYGLRLSFTIRRPRAGIVLARRGAAKVGTLITGVQNLRDQ